jgi:hypothetical protein
MMCVQEGGSYVPFVDVCIYYIISHSQPEHGKRGLYSTPWGWECFNSGCIFMHNVDYLYLKQSFKINNQEGTK